MKMRRLLCSALLCVCLSAAAFAQDKPAPSDDRITDQVSMRLAVDPDVKAEAH